MSLLQRLLTYLHDYIDKAAQTSLLLQTQSLHFKCRGEEGGKIRQNVVFLLQLLEADEDTTVSLEYLDDVSTETQVTTKAIQVKSNQANPISDRAEPLWKTF